MWLRQESSWQTACRWADADEMNNMKEIVIYDSHLGLITETCNIAVGLAVTGGKKESGCFALTGKSHQWYTPVLENLSDIYLSMYRFYKYSHQKVNPDGGNYHIHIYLVNDQLAIFKFVFLTEPIQCFGKVIF